jgi:hypothetical protein
MALIGKVFDEIIEPRRGSFSAEFAEYLLSLDFSPKQHARYDTLSKKASAGKLRPSEKAELDEMLTANAILSILQSKARISLRKHTTAA